MINNIVYFFKVGELYNTSTFQAIGAEKQLLYLIQKNPNLFQESKDIDAVKVISKNFEEIGVAPAQQSNTTIEVKEEVREESTNNTTMYDTMPKSELLDILVKNNKILEDDLGKYRKMSKKELVTLLS